MSTDAFQNELWQDAEQMKFLLTRLPSGILIIDCETQKILEVNDAISQMTGRPKEEILGRHCQEVLCSSTDGKCDALTLRGTENRITKECALLSGNDCSIPIMKTVTLVQLGGRECILESIVDISAQKKVENRLRTESQRVEKLALEANKANQTKSEFLANISHELRTPLNGVLGMASLLKETPLSEDQECYADTMFVCAESLLKLVNGVLDYSNIEAGQIELSIRRFSPRHLLGSVVELAKAPIKNKQLGFNVNFPETLTRNLMGDPSRLQQVLMILIDNAIKFTSTGTISVQMETTETTPNDRKLRFTVTDSGIGIPDDKRDFIFERFTQIDSSTTRKYSGTGLGLATAKSIVRLMNGKIGVHSAEGGGATFWFEVTLPLDEAAEAAGNETPGRILVVDDSKTNRDVMASLLKKMNYECDKAESGEAAIELISENDYQLVFMDIQMPEMDGLTTTKAIRAGLAGEQNEEIPIVALSANDMQDDPRWRSAGMTYCLKKPVSPDDLYQFLKRSCHEKSIAISEPAPEGPYPSLGDKPIFDRKKLLSRLMGDAQILDTVLEGFLSDIPGQIDKLAQLVEDGEMEGARIRAHGIKGASATICAERMSALCLKMEHQAELGDNQGLAIGLIELRTLFNELKDETASSVQ